MKATLPLLLALSAAPAFAQAPAPAPAAAPAIGELELMKLVWSTMAAVDQANRTGNYSVLRDLAAPGFQVANDQAKLTAIFANLRASGVDLSNTLLLAPTWRAQPRMVRPDLLQVQGAFGMRPTALSFELAYQWTGAGGWRLFGIGVSPVAMATQQPGAAQGQPQPQLPRRQGGR